MKTQTSDRIQDAFRAGKVIDSALKRAAASAKKSAGGVSDPGKRKITNQAKNTK